MPMLRRLRQLAARGLTLRVAGVVAELRLRRAGDAAHDAAGRAVCERALDRLRAAHPELAPFVDAARARRPESAPALLDFAHDHLGFVRDEAREVQLRNHLAAWRARIDDPDFRSAADDAIACSSVRSGFPDPRPLDRPARDEADRAFQARLRDDLERFEKAYGARAGLLASREAWQPAPGDDLRGRCLVDHFSARRDALRGRRVLHVAPEPELSRWLRAEAAGLGLRYQTLDPFGHGVDRVRDLAETGLPDGSVDVVICHRVLEHVVDEAAALAEVRRILAPDGFLSVSVPESMHRDATVEWFVPDATHHGHVRQYGADFAARLEAAGFRVTLERDLLDRTLADHRAAGTYPLRHYTARR